MGEGGPGPHARPGLSVGELVSAALAEDLGVLGDITSALMVPEDVEARGALVARAEGVLAGRLPAEETLARFPALRVEWELADGQPLTAGAVIGVISGPARDLLTAERTVLNFLTHLSGISSLAARYAAACAPAVVLDTRKTTPGWRSLEKAAVAAGGGVNHRMGLDDRVLIKDNHLALAGEHLADAIARARTELPGIVVEVEADDVATAQAAAAAGADWILLDNMDADELRAAVAAVAGRARLEASGGMNLEGARAAARTGVDAVSVGALTHSAPALDIGLDIACA